MWWARQETNPCRRLSRVGLSSYDYAALLFECRACHSVQKETAPEGAVSEIVVLIICVTGLSNYLSLLDLVGRNVNCDIHAGDVYGDGGGHDSNGRGHHHSMLFCANCGDGCLRL